MSLSPISRSAVCLVWATMPLISSLLSAQQTYELPKLTVYSEQVANQTPVLTFSMPISGLQFEPRVDAQTRNIPEAQADVSIRGGLFENTGFKFGAFSVYDPQTGHYLAELPIAPAMLTTPKVLTGADNAGASFNAEVGTIAYKWRPIKQRGEVSAAFGNYHSNHQNIYQGAARQLTGGQTFAADIDLARSESDGSVPYGDHHFRRVAGRVQLRDAQSQTDLFAGLQNKFFGWPNLYTPYNSNETESLKTELYALNHRHETSPGNFWQVGGYYRRNYDDYEFNRAVPGQFNPYQHTTHVRALALDGNYESGSWSVSYNAYTMRDNIQSTSLTYGRFTSRDYLKLSLIPQYTTEITGGRLALRAGATYDDTNREASALAPVVEVAFKQTGGARFYFQYSGSSQVPTYTALNSNPSAGLFRGNPNLGRETSRNLEAGTEFKSEDWTIQAAIFQRWDDELVDWTYRRSVTARTANPVDTLTTGIEVVAATRKPRYDLILGYTFLDKDSDYGSVTIDASFYALNYANHRFTAAIVVRPVPGFELRLDNEYRVQEGNSLRVIGGDEAILTSVGVYWLPKALRGLELSARIDNLWDSDYQEIPAVPAARLQWSAGLTWRY